MQQQNQLIDNMGGTIGGAVASAATSILGFIQIGDVLRAEDVAQTIVLTVVGAVLGFYINKLLKYIHK